MARVESQIHAAPASAILILGLVAAPLPVVMTQAPDTWRSFRTEMDRLFDRFAGGFGLPSLSRMFEDAPNGGFETTFSVPIPAVDITEDDTAYRLSAELPGMTETDIEVSVVDDTLTIKGVLTVTLPKKPEAKVAAKKIAVKAAA